MRIELLAATAGILVASCASTATNERGPILRTLTISGGFQAISDFSSEIRLDHEPSGRGTTIDFESDLGFDTTSNSSRIDALLRFDRRHGMSASWFSLDRSSERTTDRDLVWGEISIPAGSGIAANMETGIAKLNYRFTALVGDDWEAGASIGLHAMRWQTGLRVVTLDRRQEFEATLPLPLLGLFGNWEFAPGWRLTGSSEALYVSLAGVGAVDDLEGFVIDTLVGVEYDVMDHFGLGIGGNWFFMNVGVEDDQFALSTEYSYLGLMVFGRLFF